MTSKLPAFILIVSACLPVCVPVALARGDDTLVDAPATVSIVDKSQLGDVSGTLADIAGRIPGVALGGGRDDSATNANISFRGLGSLGGAEPLVIVNGIPVRDKRNALDALDPADIESVSVLKGPAGAALYGSRGAAGVINITTRRPAEQATDLFKRDQAYGTPPTVEELFGVGLYSEFSTKVTGALEYNQLCDFGPATVSPGWALNPWLDQKWSTLEPYGDGFRLPFDPKPAQAPPENQPSQPGESPPAMKDGEAPQAAEPSPPPSEPAEPSELERWTRGIPPWSLVRRSPECAGLLDELKPLYEARDKARADIVYYGDFTLSDWQLRENEPELNKAKQRLNDTVSEIGEILKRCTDKTPADTTMAESAKSAPPESAIPRLDLRGLLPGTTVPSARNDTIAQELAWDFLYEEYLDDLYEDWQRDPYVEYERWCDDCDVVEEWSYETGDWVTSRYQALYDESDGWPRVRPQLFVVKRVLEAGGNSLKRALAKRALFNLTYPYKSKLSLPLLKETKDAVFNADLGSGRAFADEQGRLDRYWSDRADSYVIDRLAERISIEEIVPGWNDVDTGDAGESGAPPEGGIRVSGSSDFLLQARVSLGKPYYSIDTDTWNIPAPPARAEPPVDFDPTRYRFGYNMKEGWAAFTLDATPVEGGNVTLDGYKGPTVRSLADVPDAYIEQIDDAWKPYLSSSWSVNDRLNFNFKWNESARLPGGLDKAVKGAVATENDACATEAFPQVASSAGLLAGQRVHDHWAQRAVGFGVVSDPAMDKVRASAAPVVVAVIDTGLDWHHYDFSWDNLWRNADEIPENGIDDDGNGYVDDLFGWDFIAGDNRPWDDDGHGTFVAGLIAATGGNRAGIDGVNPHARIMVLKALNSFGHTRASWLSQAILYAADNGARIINLSVAGPGLPQVVQDAIDYADARGVLVVVAAGNTGENVSGVQPGGMRHALTVAATGLDGQRATFSNWGPQIDIAAPGVHVMSLRARQTDFRLNSADTEYEPGSAIVGLDRLYYRADGTSFAAPLVAGVASLLWSKDPSLTHTDVRRMLEQSARDIDAPGRDQFTGFGLLDARAALGADPDFFIKASIDSVAVASVNGSQVVRVTGIASADRFAKARLEIGAGESPEKWKPVGKPLKSAQPGGLLGDIPTTEFEGSSLWILRVVVEHADGRRREARYRLNLG